MTGDNSGGCSGNLRQAASSAGLTYRIGRLRRSLTHSLKFGFARESLVGLADTPNSIFKRAISLRQLCGHYVRTSRRINPTRRVELNRLPKMKFVRRHRPHRFPFAFSPHSTDFRRLLVGNAPFGSFLPGRTPKTRKRPLAQKICKYRAHRLSPYATIRRHGEKPMTTVRVRRREFIAGLGSAAAWPVLAYGDETKVWRVGYLTPSSAIDQGSVELFNVFRLKLQDLGYVEGRNLRLEVRRAEGDTTRVPTLAAELVLLEPDVIVAVTPTSISAVKDATSSIPIVIMTAGDPIESGFVKSLAKPGGNITGVFNQSTDLTAKSLEVLHLTIPTATRVAILTSPNPLHQTMVKDAYAGATVLGLTIIPVMARTPADLDDAFSIMNREACDALVVLADARGTRRIVELADKWRLPTMYQYAFFVEMGGLMSYGADLVPQFQRGAFYVDKILRGTSPANLPVEQPTRLELQINLKTAKALGLTIPDSIIARADKVIE